MSVLPLQTPTNYHLPDYTSQRHNRVHTGRNYGVLQDRPTSKPKQPRHPGFLDFNIRLFSYRNWSYESVQSSRLLAANGFFYTGESDLVRCYSCSLGLKDFLSTSDPLVEHARYSPECTVVLQQLDLPANDSQITSPRNSERNRKADGQTDLHRLSTDTNVRQTVDAPITHPEYDTYTVRLASYTKWSLDRRQTPRQLAEAGFYYTGCGDTVCCFACGGGLSCWDPLDDPWIEHTRHFPHCTFVIRTKGEDYMLLVQRYYRNLINPELPGVPSSGTRVNTATNIREKPSSVDLSHTHRTVQTHLLEMGFCESVVSKAMEELSQARTDISLETTLEEILRMQDFNNSSSYMTTERTQITDYAKEHARLKYDINCKVCRAFQSNILFLPCQHHCCCSTCSETTGTCPLCCARVELKVKTFS